MVKKCPKNFCAGLPYELQENLSFKDQYYLFWPILLKFMVLHIRVTLLNKKNMKLCSPIFTSENYDFFLKLFTKENCQIWCRNPILPKFKANNFSIIMTKGIKMAWIIMWHDVSSYLNQSKIRKSKIDKSDLLDTIGPLESVCLVEIGLTGLPKTCKIFTEKFRC